MRKLLLGLATCASIIIHAQQVAWLSGSPVAYAMNPAMPRHELAAVPGHVVAMRMVDVAMVYGSTAYGLVALDALDPATGATWLSCLLTDSVSVGDAVVHPAGIAYFTGRFSGDVLEFCDGSQLPGIGGFLTENLFLMAWNLNTGMPLWTRNLSVSHPNGYDVPSIALDPDGNLWYIMQDFLDGRVVRVDEEGNDVEVRPINGIRRFGTISFDPWGGLYASGSCENGTLIFGGQGFPVSSAEGYNMFVLRYKPDGTAGFAEFAADGTFHNPSVAATNDGHAYVAGNLMQPQDSWDGLSFTGANWGSDLFLVKVDSTGQFLWGVESNPATGVILGDLERAAGACIAVDASNNVYLPGVARGTVDWGNGVVSGGPGITQRRLTVVAFDPNGTPQWAANSDPANWFVTAQALTAEAEPGALHFVAHTTGEFTFGPHTANSGGAQAAVFGRISGLSTEVAEKSSLDGLQVWPNPASELLHVECSRSTTVRGELINSAGQRVGTMQLRPGRNAMDVSGLVPGLYLLRVEGREAVRVVVE